MRLIGLLSHYDEPPHLLTAAITSLVAHCHIDHLVSCDGAYYLYPHGRPHSGPLADTAILETCHAAGIGVTLHTPQHTWWGNEVEKRTAMFRLAEPTAEPDDWYIVMDADQIVTQAPQDLKQLLANTQHDAAQVTFWQRTPEARDTISILFRAIPGLHCHTNHYTYRTPDGRNLWSQGHDQEPCEDLTHLFKVEHRPNMRPIVRIEAARAYYHRREQLGIETNHAHPAQVP